MARTRWRNSSRACPDASATASSRSRCRCSNQKTSAIAKRPVVQSVVSITTAAAERFQEHLRLKGRHDGVMLALAHPLGGSIPLSLENHRVLAQLLQEPAHVAAAAVAARKLFE